MAKKRLLNILKWSFSIGILVYLVRSGKLSLADVQAFLSHPLQVGICFLIISAVLSLAFLRWNVVLRGLGIDMDYWSTLRLGMLGQFFSAIIPGSVGGDLVKAFYVARRFPNKKTLTLSTVLIDRVLGLSALVFVGAIAFLLGRPALAGIQRDTTMLVESFGWILVSAAAIIFSALLLFSFFGKRLPLEAPTFLSKLPLAKAWLHLYSSLIPYRNAIEALWKAIGISFLIHSGNMLILFTAAWGIFGPPPWGDVGIPLFILGAVLGNCSLAIPVAPMGLGVGQVAFSAIFWGIGAPSVSFGSGIVTAIQIISLVSNLCGVFFYATYKTEMKEALSS